MFKWKRICKARKGRKNIETYSTNPTNNTMITMTRNMMKKMVKITITSTVIKKQSLTNKIPST